MAHALKPLPRHMANADGDTRRAGFEFEFAGLAMDDAVAAVISACGGTERRENRFLRVIEGADHGDWHVELDARLLKTKAYEKHLSGLGIDLDKLHMREPVEHLIESVSSEVVPCEVVSPPIPLDETGVVEDLRLALHRAKARGTKASFFYAFGFHINVEPPRLDAATLLAYLRAYLLLAPWLKRRMDIDLSRSLSPYIDDFPEDYARKVVAASYDPGGLAELMDDYLEANPTRNRGLDMLPVFAHLDEARVMAHPVEKELVKPRPALHYRLPNCRIDDADWSAGLEWEHWMRVEALADDRDALRALGREFLGTPPFPLDVFTESWADKMERWLA